MRDERLLMVASRYVNQPDPLWNLPGGRQQPGELLVETVVREFYEETHLRVRAGELAYVSESYDGDEHFLNATFLVELIDESLLSPGAQRSPERSNVILSGVERHVILSGAEGHVILSGVEGRSAPIAPAGEHVVAVEWVPLEAVSERIVVRVVREPLVAYLQDRMEGRYAGYHDAGITIEWPADSL